jgi:alpha-mannosidase
LQKSNATYPVRRDDSFPYAENNNQYWSGFYTSKPELKKHVRETSSRFHSMLRLSSLEVLRQQPDDAILKMVV